MSRLLEETLIFNENFVADKAYEPYITGKYPQKKIVIVTCMDTRLTELLPKALNIRNGDVKMIKVAGAYVNDPYGGEMRSILVGVSLLQADEVWVIGHHECGLIGLEAHQVLTGLGDKQASKEALVQASDDPKANKWLSGPPSVQAAVKQSVETIRNHRLFPATVPVYGLVIHPKTGKLEQVDNDS